MKFFKVDYRPAFNEHLTPKINADYALDEISLVGKDKGHCFNNHNLTNINSITLDNQAVNDNQVIIKSYVNQFHQENEKIPRDSEIDF